MNKKPHSTVTISRGFKSLLVSEDVFKQLQVIQQALPKPNRLTLGDLATGAVEEALSLSSADRIVERARIFVGKSFL